MKKIGLFFILALMVLGTSSYAELEDGLVSVWNFKRRLSKRFHRQ